MDDTTTLTRKIKQGNKKAFKDFYDKHHMQMFYLARRYVKDQQLAEDAVQDVFLKLWNKRATLDSSKSIKAFVSTMLKNHLLNMIRDRKKRIHSAYEDIQEEKMEHDRKTDEQVIYKEYEKIFSRGLDKLSQGKKEVFQMKTEEGLSNKQVASRRDVSINTVKSQFYRGSQFIRSYLRKHADIQS